MKFGEVGECVAKGFNTSKIVGYLCSIIKKSEVEFCATKFYLNESWEKSGRNSERETTNRS